MSNQEIPVGGNESEMASPAMSAEVLLSQLVNIVGPDFMVLPLQGWVAILQTIHEFEEDHEDVLKEKISEKLNDLNIPAVPVQLAPKEEERRIITPDDIRGESRIITP
jgi:hypothetical protein